MASRHNKVLFVLYKYDELVKSRHSRAGGNPVFSMASWIPTFVGMTERADFQRSRPEFIEVNHSVLRGAQGGMRKNDGEAGRN